MCRCLSSYTPIKKTVLKYARAYIITSYVYTLCSCVFYDYQNIAILYAIFCNVFSAYHCRIYPNE